RTRRPGEPGRGARARRYRPGRAGGVAGGPVHRRSAARGGVARTGNAGRSGARTLDTGARGDSALATGVMAGVRRMGTDRRAADLARARRRRLPSRTVMARRVLGILAAWAT